MSPVTGRAPSLEGTRVNTKRDRAGFGQCDAEIGFEFPFDDLPLEDHQCSTGDVLRRGLAGSNSPLEGLLRRLRFCALVPLPVPLALGLELLEAVADPIDQAPLKAGRGEPTIASSSVASAPLEGDQLSPNRRRDHGEEVHRHRDIRLEAIEAVNGRLVRALGVPGLHLAKASDRHDGSIDGHAPP